MAVGSFRNFFDSLGGAVGDGRASRPDDVAKVQDALRGLGRYPTGRGSAEAGVLDGSLDRAIRGYQVDRGLKRDGWLAPRGETAAEVGTDLGLLHLAKASGNRPQPAPDRAYDIMRSRASAFDNLGWLGNKLGLGDGGFARAGDYLKHYLERSGAPRTLTSDEVDKEPALLGAERANRALIETRTLTGTTGRRSLNDILKNLPDGGPAVEFEDEFESKLSMWNHMRRPGTYFSLGQGGVLSAIKGSAKRVGDQIVVDSSVTHRLDNRPRAENEKNRFGETYDFNPGQPGHAEARVLEPSGRARTFDIDYTRRQPLTAIVRRGPDGELTVDRAI